MNNSVVINASQDVNNNEQQVARTNQRNNASANEGDDHDLGDLEPSLFEGATDPFEII